MPDGITFKVINSEELNRWFRRWAKKTKQTKATMAAMATFYLQQIFRTFRASGARDGLKAWPGYNRGKGHILGGATRTKTGTWNIRYGTGKKPKRTAAKLKEYKTENNLWFKRGPMKGYESDSRYSAGSKMLLASGGFRGSFRRLRLSDTVAVVGTTMPKADKIVGLKKGGVRAYRPVIRISSKDRSQFAKLLLKQFVPEQGKPA